MIIAKFSYDQIGSVDLAPHIRNRIEAIFSLIYVNYTFSYISLNKVTPINWLVLI